jgi:ribosome biogenesis GTPase
MSKRRITTQQANRIQKKQHDYQTSTTLHQTDRHDGLVITRFGRHAEIERTDGTRIHCAIRPHLQSIVAGDRVVWQMETETQGIVVSQYPQQTLLARVNAHGQTKPFAANMTQLCIVVAPEPLLSWILLDSYLIMAEMLHLQACIIMNKFDLMPTSLREPLDTIYRHLYPVVFTGVEHLEGDQTLTDLLNHQISIFVGQSGVGKSSLIKRLLPHEKSIQVGALSDHTQLGRHTTSATTFYHIPTGGALIDSPGVREFNLQHLNLTHIADGFCEFRPFIKQCKFRDCAHHNTPGCAVLDAVKKDLISTHRYKNYVTISKLS